MKGQPRPPTAMPVDSAADVVGGEPMDPVTRRLLRERIPEVLGRLQGDLVALLAIALGCGAILSRGFDVGFVESTLLMVLLGLCLMSAAAVIFRR